MDNRFVVFSGTGTKYKMRRALRTQEQNALVSRVPSIQAKIRGYLCQDRKHGHVCDIVTFDDVLNLLSANATCYYCNLCVKTEWTVVKDALQWTLDRLDNEKGHCLSNVVVCCLKCNLQRRKRDATAFLFTKNLVLNKVL